VILGSSLRHRLIPEAVLQRSTATSFGRCADTTGHGIMLRAERVDHPFLGGRRRQLPKGTRSVRVKGQVKRDYKACKLGAVCLSTSDVLSR